MFRYAPHPHIARHKTAEPTKVADHFSILSNFNAKLAVKITDGVGTMACAWCFAVIALVSLPAAIASGSPVIVVQWLSSVFLQLVLLSIILVGQRVQSAAADKRAVDTYADAEALLAEAVQIQAHLKEQDELLTRLAAASPDPRLPR